ncbi:MAG: carboxypeptidase regulatory-like domain-containing protein [Candidatus Rokubacteria bacterium]|nr:carboxypeptidase regulatory-like domain-containing protein [Candidatus Rokubacteria bacterium]
MRAPLALALLAVLVCLPGAAVAEHEVQFRFTVLGYVKDAKGQPLTGEVVEVTRNKTGLAYQADTDAQGLYMVTARLGDEALGETLTVRVGGARTTVAVGFEAANHHDERGTRVDLEGTRWLVRPAWFRSTLARILAPPAR